MRDVIKWSIFSIRAANLSVRNTNQCKLEIIIDSEPLKEINL